MSDTDSRSSKGLRPSSIRQRLGATYSLCACDLEARRWGVAVQSKFLAVGSIVPWARADERLEDWAGVESLEQRVDGEDAVDPLVLDRLRAAS